MNEAPHVKKALLLLELWSISTPCSSLVCIQPGSKKFQTQAGFAFLSDIEGVGAWFNKYHCNTCFLVNVISPSDKIVSQSVFFIKMKMKTSKYYHAHTHTIRCDDDTDVFGVPSLPPWMRPFVCHSLLMNCWPEALVSLFKPFFLQPPPLSASHNGVLVFQYRWRKATKICPNLSMRMQVP